jgi:hypothetical protein
VRAFLCSHATSTQNFSFLVIRNFIFSKSLACYHALQIGVLRIGRIAHAMNHHTQGYEETHRGAVLNAPLNAPESLRCWFSSVPPHGYAQPVDKMRQNASMLQRNGSSGSQPGVLRRADALYSLIEVNQNSVMQHDVT